MSHVYPALLEAEPEGGFTVTFPEIGFGATYGASWEEARRQAEDMLEEAGEKSWCRLIYGVLRHQPAVERGFQYGLAKGTRRFQIGSVERLHILGTRKIIPASNSTILRASVIGGMGIGARFREANVHARGGVFGLIRSAGLRCS